MYYKMQPIIVNILQTIWNGTYGLLQNIFFYVTIILTKQQASYIKKGILKKVNLWAATAGFRKGWY